VYLRNHRQLGAFEKGAPFLFLWADVLPKPLIRRQMTSIREGFLYT
jgi:hypothetical protein